MSLFRRVRQSVQMRLYRFVSTEQLITQLRTKTSKSGNTLIRALKERLAHQDGTLTGTDLSNIQLNEAILSSAKLTNTSFSQAQLIGAYFAYSDLSNTDFSNANLTEAHFRETNLSNTNFTGATLKDVNFARANLSNANLTNADLTNANLWRADLRGANLTDAILTDANFDDVQIDEHTILPDGSTGQTTLDWADFLK